MNAIFYISAAVALVSTLLVITRSNAVHALLYLIVSLLSVAVIFFLLGAPFVAALEVMLQTVGIANLIRENKCYQIDAYLQTADPGSGMQSLDTCLFQYVRDGLITLEEGLRVASYPDVLKRMAAELPEEQ